MEDALEALEQRCQFTMAARQPPVEDDVRTGATDDPQITLRGAATFLIRIITANRRFVGLNIASGQQPGMHLSVKTGSSQFAVTSIQSLMVRRLIDAPQRCDICSN